MTCSEQGCGRKTSARGLCAMHYHQQRRAADPDYDHRHMHTCRKCRAWISGLDMCVPCRVLAAAVKNDGWKVKKLEHSTYYRRMVGDVTIRIYDGPSVRWEMDGPIRFRQGKAKSVIDVIRRVRENENKIKARENRKKAWFGQD